MATQKLGEKIKERRKKLGISADSLAEKIGKDRATIYRYESGEIENMPITEAYKIASVLDIPLSFLLGIGQKEELGLLEQDRAQIKKPETIIPNSAKKVNAGWLVEFRAANKLKPADIISALRRIYPSFDKFLCSKVENPEKYGIQLTQEAQDFLQITFASEKLADNHHKEDE